MWVNLVYERSPMVFVNRILLDARQGSLCFSVGFSILRFSAYEKELKHEHVII